MKNPLLLIILTIAFAVITGYGVYITDEEELRAMLDHFPASILSFSLVVGGEE